MARICPWLALVFAAHAHAQEAPVSGPERVEWMREHLVNTVSKFEFTQGYSFRKSPEDLEPFMEAIKARGFSVWDQHPEGYIWRDEHFEHLERSIQVAAEVGLEVWATLVPPSGKQEIARWPLEDRQEYYYTTTERFAKLAAKYPNFVAFTCDDIDYNWGFFTPEMLAEMARRWRGICPRLAFLPLVYGVSEGLFETRGEYLDGIVYHFRAGSYPYAYIPGYDPKSFEMYGDVMRHELKRVRQIAGEHPVVCGIYIWYYRSGWGVLTPDEQDPNVEHIVRDATQKLAIAHEYADGVRVYGLGIDHEAYRAMGELVHQWQAEGSDWGQKRGDPESHLGKWRAALADGPFLGTLLDSDRGLGRDLPRHCPWSRIEVVRDFQGGRFEPEEAVRRYPLLLVSKARMGREWPGLLAQYARAGGTLALEFVPGWQLDMEASALREGEKEASETCPTTREMGELSGVEFHYEPRGFATRWRVVKTHPLTAGLGEVGAWREVPYEDVASTYGHLVHPVRATDAEVLIEVEHEGCPYDGVSYVRDGAITGIYPLLTSKQVGQGHVVRHFAHNSPTTVFGDAYQRLMENVADLPRGH